MARPKKSSNPNKKGKTYKTQSVAPANGQALVVVEAPGKVQKIQGYLGPNYVVMASVGHILDLPKKGLGVDLDNDYKPTYEVLENKVEVVDGLKQAASTTDTVYLCSDPDREGEFISYSVARELNRTGMKFHRVTYNAITKTAIQAAFQAPRALDKNLVRAQQTRRILDRLVGFKASPLLWNTIQKGLSAGRVQSVALRIIVDRQAEIDAFKPRDYWTIKANLKTATGEMFPAELSTEYDTEVDANAIVATLNAGKFTVKSVEVKPRTRNPLPPFTTSQMIQQAGTVLGWNAKRTNSAAQQLYEASLTTYIRTDSVFIDPTAITSIRGELQTQGAKYLPAVPNVYASKANAQEAHEAIRPTDIAHHPTKNIGQIPPDCQTLYELIWRRALGSQSTPAEFEQMIAVIENSGLELTAKGQKLIFDGFLKFWTYSDSKETLLPPLSAGMQLVTDSIEAIKHTTKPPARYNTASLVKELEENGVGRPSTYQAIVDTLIFRKYVSEDGKAFAPTEIGKEVVKILKTYTPGIVDIAYTAAMEGKLDEVANGTLDWIAAIDFCWKPLAVEIEKANTTIVQNEVETQIVCPACNKEKLLRKISKAGPFYACSNRKECGKIYQIGDDGTPQERKVETYTEPCKTCGAQMIKKFVRATGVSFYGCENYATTGCKTTVSAEGVWKLPQQLTVLRKCEKCKKGNLVLRMNKKNQPFAGCDNFPKCRNLKSVGPDGKIIETPEK